MALKHAFVKVIKLYYVLWTRAAMTERQREKRACTEGKTGGCFKFLYFHTTGKFNDICLSFSEYI